MKNWKKSKDNEFRIIMEPVPEQGVIPCCKGDPLYCFQKEQTMQDDMAARTGKILDRYQVNQDEASFSGQAVIV